MIGAKPNLKAAREAQKAAEAKSKAATGAEYLLFVSSRSLKTREKYTN